MNLIARQLLFLLAAVFSMFSVLEAQEPWEGVWKLNPAKSLPFENPPKSQVFTTKTEDGMLVQIEDITTAKGVEYRVTLKMALDGKDYPVEGSRAGIELVSGKRLGPNSVEIKAKKKDGTVLGTYWSDISTDGKSRINMSWPGPEITGPPARVQTLDRQ